MYQRIKSGDWIRKANNTVFKEQYGANGVKIIEEGEELPFLKVDTIQFISSGKCVINGIYWVNPYNIKIMTEEEFIEYKGIWDSCNISPTDEPFEIDSCIRKDTGEPKKKLPGMPSLRRILFEKVIKKPEALFQAYKCSHCGEYHIGKKKQEQL